MKSFGEPFCGFCRDCLTMQLRPAQRCHACGSPRVMRHGELYDLSIAHLDCDAFYAAVEKRDNPELADRPVIVGGGKRGVVSTACYIARIHGVKSAMPMFKALKACPEAVVIKPDMEKYVAVGRQVRALMLELTPAVEPISIDEAFLDLNGTEMLHRAPPAFVLARLAKRIRDEIGITVSIGLSYCKFLAKVASDLEKPRGFSVIGRAEAVSFLAGRPVTTIWGVGKAFAATLEKDGIRTIGHLQGMQEADLIRRYGVIGQRLFHLARGEDSRTVSPHGEAKSVSAETTFNEDYADFATLAASLRALSEQVAARLKKADIAGRTVVLKLKDKSFQTRTRNRQLADPTQLADRIFRTAVSLLEKEVDGAAFRLIGVGVTDLGDDTAADPADLVDDGAQKRAAVEAAMDKVRAKFGGKALETGYTFGKGSRGRPRNDDS